jgi:hypothetical protein
MKLELDGPARTIIVEPMEVPAPRPEPVPEREPEPVSVPQREPEKVPA